MPDDSPYDLFLSHGAKDKPVGCAHRQFSPLKAGFCPGCLRYFGPDYDGLPD